MKLKKVSQITILVLLLAFSMATTSFAATGCITDRNDIKATNWMKYLPDSMPLVEANLPGTHNTACRYFKNVAFTYSGITANTSLINKYGKTQNLSIPEQLNAGIRFFDCRIALVESIDKNHLTVPHNMLVTADKKDNGDAMKVETVVAYAEEFVAKHPSETVVITAERDGRSYDTSSSDFLKLENELIESFRNNPTRTAIASGEASPNVGQTRGKVVIIRGNDFYGLGGDSALDGDNNWDLVKTYFNASQAQKTSGSVLLVKSRDRSLARPLDMNTSCRGDIPIDIGIPGLVLPNPKDNAEIFNAHMLNYNFEIGKFYGWFLMDYVTEDLNRKVFLSNTLNEGILSGEHEVKHVESADATYEKAGNYEYWHCDKCDKYYKDEACTEEYTNNAWVIPQKTQGSGSGGGGGGNDTSGSNENPEDTDLPEDDNPAEELSEAEQISAIQTSKIAKPKLKIGKKKITILWKRPSGIMTTKYYIYRATKNKAKYFKKIKTITNGKLKYIDKKGLKKGKRYYYKVVGAAKIGDKYYKTKASTAKSVKFR